MDLYPGQLGISCFPRPSVSPPLVSHLSLEPSFASRFAVSGLTPLTPPTAGDSAVRHPTCVSVRITSRCPGLKVGPPPRSSMGSKGSCFHSRDRSDRFTVARFAGARRPRPPSTRRLELEPRGTTLKRQNRNPPSETQRLKKLAGTFV